MIRTLMDQGDAVNEDSERKGTLEALAAALAREGFGPFYATEQARRQQLESYLTKCSEAELIEKALLPLFRQMVFHRITAAGHKGKALAYGEAVSALQS